MDDVIQILGFPSEKTYFSKRSKMLIQSDQSVISGTISKRIIFSIFFVMIGQKIVHLMFRKIFGVSLHFFSIVSK